MMMWLSIVVLVLAALLWRSRGPRRKGGHLLRNTGPYWRCNYSRRSFLRLGGALAAAAGLAYSGADEAIESWHSTEVRSSTSDRLAGLVEPAGKKFWFLGWLLVAFSDAYLRTNTFSRWGRKNFEAMLVGLPVLWTLQRGLGANRPSSDDASPRWRPLAAANSASGHAFIAAVPWLNLARRVPSRSLSGLASVLSTLTGWSRLNDRKHYLSQILLGWTIAWNATSAVDDPALLLPVTTEVAEAGSE